MGGGGGGGVNFSSPDVFQCQIICQSPSPLEKKPKKTKEVSDKGWKEKAQEERMSGREPEANKVMEKSLRGTKA